MMLNNFLDWSCILRSGLLLTLSMACVLAQSSNQAPANGAVTRIILNARIKPSFNAGRPEIECEIINATPSPVDYDAWLVPLGFDFRLRDALGVEVAMNERWFAINSPRYREYTKSRTRKITPGDKIAYTLRLDEAFGPAWKRGVKLEVGWFQQGSDNDSPTMSTEVLLPLSKMTASEKVEEPNAIEKAGASPALQLPFTTKPPPTPEAKPTALVKPEAATQWLVWSIVILAAIGLLWLALKKQK